MNNLLPQVSSQRRPRSVYNATLSIFTSSGRLTSTERRIESVEIDLKSVNTFLLDVLKRFGSLKYA